MLKKLSSLKSLLATLLLGAALVGCNKSSGPGEHPDRVGNRTVIAYMIADNNLYNDIIEDINEMEQGWNPEFDGTMLVYLYPTNSDYRTKGESRGRPRIMRLVHDEDTKTINSEVLKIYPERHNPLDVNVMQAVIKDAMELAPAHSYAVSLSSHALGWIPDGKPPYLKSYSPGQRAYGLNGQMWPMTRTFGSIYSYNTQSELYDMARVGLNVGVKFDFIMFDACLMASVESTYELRYLTEYVIASSAEIMSGGFQYQTVIPKMFEKTADVVGIAEEFINFYKAQVGALSSGTISVVKTSELEDLAKVVKSIVETNQNPTIPIGDIFFFTGNLSTPIWYDLEDYIQKTWPNSQLLIQFIQAMDKAVVFKGETEKFFNTPIRTHCGMNCYVPTRSSPKATKIYATEYSWSVDTGLDQIAITVKK